MSEIHPLLADIAPEKVLCLDAEFADGACMLELSICDAVGNPVYNRRFKPRKLTKWGLTPHNISPADVADKPYFSECAKDIQTLVDSADYILGFALENDIKMLANEGVIIPKNKNIIELRDWFWILYGRRHDMDHANHISNESIANALSIHPDEARLHSAQYDALLSLLSFSRLLDFATETGLKSTTFPELYAEFKPVFRTAKDEYDRSHAAGYCYIQSAGDEYRVKFSAAEPENKASVVACIKVENRKKAMMDISRLFLGRNLAGNFRLPKLTASKLALFKAYTNAYNKEERDLDSKLLRLTRMYGKKRK